ncbi:hypothetical protein DFS33DRAFT_1369161 [Desarmillaria ectypa]|nr:hypothetical protein DFS33DRAFT_1369161 [Desarmillaria ectypa]
MIFLCRFHTNLMRTFPSLLSLWGEEWDPTRFFDKAAGIAGWHANLMTFNELPFSESFLRLTRPSGTGPRSCIGWRFANPSQLDSTLRIQFTRGRSQSPAFSWVIAVVPIVTGKAHLDSQLPIKVRVLH